MLSVPFGIVAGQNVFFFWGGGNLTELNLGGPEETPLKSFEIFILEITANAPNFKNQLIYMGPAPPLVTALTFWRR